MSLTVTLSASKPASLKADVLVIGVAHQPAQPAVGEVLLPTGLPAKQTAALRGAAAALRLKGEPGEVSAIPASDAIAAQVVVFTGIGAAGPDEDPAYLERLRRAAGAAVRSLSGRDQVALALPAATPGQVEAVALGALLGAYVFDAYKEVTAPARELIVLTPLARDKKAIAGTTRAQVIAREVGRVRDLVNTAPNQLYPQEFAERVADAASGTGVKVTVLDEQKLAKQGFGGILAVGQGSVRPPRLVKVQWAPARVKTHVAIVGKGITFDSGGLSLKPPASMETMKSDMAGAATVLGTVLAAAALRVPVKVTAWLALAENMPSATAQRPGDVITMRDGTTVEVLNTDAEGRLVLADAITAAKQDKADTIIDIATLTGAQLVALGPLVAGVMGSEQVRTEVVAAADAAGEHTWPMPLPAELAEGLKSPIADMKNIADRNGGMLVAGLFLQHFAGDTPWAHMDVAGPAFNEREAFGYTPKGGTGMGLRTLLAYLESLA